MALRRAPAAALLWSALVCLLPANAVVAQAEVEPGRGPRRRVVVLDDSACSGVPASELRELVRLELAPRVLRVASDDDATTRVLLTCDTNSARLVVREAARPAQELVLDLSSIVVAARARLIALSLAELLATAEMEPRTPPPEPAAEPEAPSPRLPARRSSGWLAAGLVRQGAPRLLAPSLQTGLVLNVAGLPLALVAELDAQRGQREVRAGHVTSWTASGSVGPATQLRAGALDLVLGAGLRLGYARLIGDADTAQESSVTGQVVSALWWGPTAGASATVRLRARWGLRAGVDLSWIARAVRGTDSSDTTVFELDGLLVHATLGLSLTLPALRLGRSQQQTL